MKVWMLLAATWIVAFGGAFAQETPEAAKPEKANIDWLPSQFKISGYFLYDDARFELQTPDTHFGYVERQKRQNWPEYVLYYVNGKIYARGSVRAFPVSRVDIVSGTGQKLGHINVRFFALVPKYDIYSIRDEHIATVKVNFWDTSAKLVLTGTDQVAATMTHPFFTFGDKWNVTVGDQELLKKTNIDTRLIIMALVFHTDRKWQRKAALGHAIEEMMKEQSKNKTSSLDLPRLHLIGRSIAANEPDQQPVAQKVELPKVEDASQLMSELVQIENELSQYSEKFKDITPTAEDIQTVQQITNDRINAQEEAIDEEAVREHLSETSALTDQQRIIDGIQYLMPMLSGNELTDGQKAALVKMMEKLLEDQVQ